MAHRNLIRNPKPRGPQGWTTTLVNATQNVWTPPAAGQTGTMYLKATATADDAVMLIDTSPYTILPVQSGRFYTVIVDELEIIQRPTNPGALFLVLLAFYDASGVPVAQVFGDDLSTGIHDSASAIIRNQRAPIDGYAIVRIGCVEAESGSVVEFTAGRVMLAPHANIATGELANFAPPTGRGWYPLAEPNAILNTFEVDTDLVHYSATSTAEYAVETGSHCSVYFQAFPTPGTTWRLTVPQFNLLQIPAGHVGVEPGPAIYFVLIDEDGNGLGEYAGPMLTETGIQDLVYELEMPDDAYVMRVVIGSGGPTVDGRFNPLFDGDTVEFQFDPTQVTLEQIGLTLTPINKYIDGDDEGFFWSSVPYNSVSLQRVDPLLTVRGDEVSDELVRFAEASLESDWRSRPYLDAILQTPGLVAYWPLDETEGTIFTDIRGDRIATIDSPTGVTYGQPSILPGDPYGKSYLRNKSVTSPHDPALVFLGNAPFTLECWHKRTLDDVASFLMDHGASSTRWSMRISTGGFLIAARNANTLNSGAEVPVGETGYFVVTYNGVTLATYVNGEFILSEDQALELITDHTANIGLGNQSSKSNGAMGYLQHMAIYNRALSAREIEFHYEIGTTPR